MRLIGRKKDIASKAAEAVLKETRALGAAQDIKRVAVANAVDRLIFPPDEYLAEQARLAAVCADLPTGVVNIVTADYQVTKAGWNVPDGTLGVQMPLTYSLCVFVIADRHPLVVEDARENPETSACLSVPKIRAYTGVPIVVHYEVVGALAAYGPEPKKLDPAHVGPMQTIAHQIAEEIELRSAQRDV